MTTNSATKNRSGSRAPVHPKTRAQRLRRFAELTERMDARAAEIDDLGRLRDQIIKDLRDLDGLTFREIGESAGKSEQAVHKAYQKAMARE